MNFDTSAKCSFDKIVKSQNSRVLSWWALRLAQDRLCWTMT